MEYFIGLVLSIVFFLLLIRFYKKIKNDKIEDKERRLKSKIQFENNKTKEIYGSIDTVRNYFELMFVGKRLIAHGEIDGFLLIFKYKNDKLRIGVPWKFNTQKRYHDTEADFSSLDDDGTYYFYNRVREFLFLLQLFRERLEKY